MSTKVSVATSGAHTPDGEGATNAPKRGRKRALISLGACAAVLAALAAVAPFTSVMPVRSVAVEGNHILTADHVEELAAIPSETPMGRVNLTNAANSVASDPWVKSVTVSRNWPSTIDISLSEHAAVAFVAQADGTHLIDEDGVDFLVADPPPEAIELVNAPVQDVTEMADVVAIAASISSRARQAIAAIEVQPDNYVLRTVDNKRITWGASEDNENKSYALEAVLQMEGTEFNIVNPQLVGVK